MSYNRLIIIMHDLLMIVIAWLGAYWLRFNLEIIPLPVLQNALVMLPWLMLIQALAYYSFGLYRGIWRFASIPDLVRIIKAVIIGAACAALGIFLLNRMEFVPRSIFLLYVFSLIGLLSGSRLTFRWLKEHTGLFSNAEKTLIIGAGAEGEAIARELFRDPQHRYHPIAFIDEAPEKRGQEIHGIRVYMEIQKIPLLVKKHDVKLVIIAASAISREKMEKIVSYCEQAKVPFRTLPAMVDIAAGNITINALKDVSIEDLLGREPVTLDWQRIQNELTGKVVLVTGGGGSIGSELCRQIAQFNPKQLIILDSSEFNLYKIDLELKEKYPDLPLTICLADILDEFAIDVIMQQQPEIVFHTAAYKHVPLLEQQTRAAIRNNILGTQIVAKFAVANKVKKFVLISTDKAVNPTNVLGATKRVAEIYCQNYNKYSDTQFITVRFGNVLGSAGSVVPLFRKQLEAGGPLTVTHPEMTRFFMTIPEATLLILQATVIGQGGEIFVLDMGEQIKIRYLAEQMIRLSGKEPGKEIGIIYTGLRPGEKLYEELFYDNEILAKTSHKKIMQAQSVSWEWAELNTSISEIIAVADKNLAYLKQLLKKIVTTYIPN